MLKYRENEEGGNRTIEECLIVTCMTTPPGGGEVGAGVNLTLVYSFVLFQEEQR